MTTVVPAAARAARVAPANRADASSQPPLLRRSYFACPSETFDWFEWRLQPLLDLRCPSNRSALPLLHLVYCHRRRLAYESHRNIIRLISLDKKTSTKQVQVTIVGLCVDCGILQSQPVGELRESWRSFLQNGLIPVRIPAPYQEGHASEDCIF